jgi:hypothetical protein
MRRILNPKQRPHNRRIHRYKRNSRQQNQRAPPTEARIHSPFRPTMMTRSLLRRREATAK